MNDMRTIRFDRMELWTLLERVLGTREAIEITYLLAEIEENEFPPRIDRKV